MELKVSVLASGSSGNCILIQSEGHSILIDFGISVRRFKGCLSELGCEIKAIEAIFISHEHTDHISGLGYLEKEIEVPVFATEGTVKVLSGFGFKNLEGFRCGQEVRVNNFSVQGFRVPHDAIEPVGFIVKSEGRMVGVATDLGSVNGLVRERLKGSDLLIIESNYEPELLLNGSYPWHLKQRIMSRYGHLSNQDCAFFLGEMKRFGLFRAVLAHLSEKNNKPELAYKVVRDSLGDDVEIYLTSQRNPGPSIEIC